MKLGLVHHDEIDTHGPGRLLRAVRRPRGRVNGLADSQNFFDGRSWHAHGALHEPKGHRAVHTATDGHDGRRKAAAGHVLVEHGALLLYPALNVESALRAVLGELRGQLRVELAVCGGRGQGSHFCQK